MIEQAVFSHTDLFVKPKLVDNSARAQNAETTRIYNIHAIVGQAE